MYPNTFGHHTGLERTEGKPCIPSWLGNFSIHRTFRNAEYDIQVENPGRVEKGIVSMTVDGKAVEGCIIPFEEGKKHYDVKVVMG